MEISPFDPQQSGEVTELFIDVFTTSENEEQGRSVGKLAADLIATTSPEDFLGFVATRDGRVVGGILFSRLEVASGEEAFILSPVAIATAEQGTGVGQRLINFGLDALRERGVSLAFTYGNPAYYSKTGFQTISEEVVRAPCKLSIPQGWLAQSLRGETIEPMSGSTRCVAALDDPDYW